MPKRLRYNHCLGFTLIEFILVIIIIGIIGATASYALVESVQGVQKAQDYGQVSHEARLAMERMVRNVRTIPTTGAIITPIGAGSSSTLTFTMLSGRSVKFEVSGTNLLLKEPDTAPGVILASGVSSLTFRFYDAAGNLETAAMTNVNFIQIDMTVSVGGKTLRVWSNVYPDNFR